ncbi:MAG: hypothetical protein RL456_929 [Pseudomonadota bacterium]
MSLFDRTPQNRRRMLAGTGAVGALAAAAAVLPTAPQPVAAVAPQPRPEPDAAGGYQLSEHVQRYYQTARV